MFQIAETPEPPYYAVIAPALLGDDAEGYPQMALLLMEAARDVDGFLGIEACIQGRFSLAVSYWRSLEAIDQWRHNARHLVAKGLAKKKWFESYVTRIAKVERVY